MFEVLAMATAIAAVTSGVVQAIKKTEKINKRYMPLVAILVGLILGALALFMDIGLVERLWAGGISGLAATGLFELGKNTVESGD
ncbi:holin [Pseudogracilibacillus sp. SE30717A]|uniref:holin n=1 Tax=Pseudogracilibacillus sp. SE30717A TaxID=3098293 RepID=UPI00300E0342